MYEILVHIRVILVQYRQMLCLHHVRVLIILAHVDNQSRKPISTRSRTCLTLFFDLAKEIYTGEICVVVNLLFDYKLCMSTDCLT